MVAALRCFTGSGSITAIFIMSEDRACRPSWIMDAYCIQWRIAMAPFGKPNFVTIEKNWKTWFAPSFTSVSTIYTWPAKIYPPLF